MMANVTQGVRWSHNTQLNLYEMFFLIWVNSNYWRVSFVSYVSPDLMKFLHSKMVSYQIWN